MSWTQFCRPCPENSDLTCPRSASSLQPAQQCGKGCSGATFPPCYPCAKSLPGRAHPWAFCHPSAWRHLWPGGRKSSSTGHAEPMVGCLRCNARLRFVGLTLAGSRHLLAAAHLQNVVCEAVGLDYSATPAQHGPTCLCEDSWLGDAGVWWSVGDFGRSGWVRSPALPSLLPALRWGTTKLPANPNGKEDLANVQNGTDLHESLRPGSEALQLLLGPCRLQECGRAPSPLVFGGLRFESMSSEAPVLRQASLARRCSPSGHRRSIDLPRG